MSAPLTIFPTRAKKGRSLASAIERLGRRHGYAVTVADPQRVTQPDLLQACLGPGVVVFDATIEGQRRHNYAFAMYALKYIPIRGREVFGDLHKVARDVPNPVGVSQAFRLLSTGFEIGGRSLVGGGGTYA
jgi:hypothetical protein